MIDYDKIAEKHGVSPETVKEVERGIFQGVKYYIEKYPGIKILLKGLGSFMVRETKMRFLILKDYEKYREGKINREELREKVSKNLEVKKRAHESKRTPNRVSQSTKHGVSSGADSGDD